MALIIFKGILYNTDAKELPKELKDLLSKAKEVPKEEISTLQIPTKKDKKK